MVKRFLGFLFFYSVLGVLLLPLVVTLLCNGLGKALPQEAEAFSIFSVQTI